MQEILDNFKGSYDEAIRDVEAKLKEAEQSGLVQFKETLDPFRSEVAQKQVLVDGKVNSLERLGDKAHGGINEQIKSLESKVGEIDSRYISKIEKLNQNFMQEAETKIAELPTYASNAARKTEELQEGYFSAARRIPSLKGSISNLTLIFQPNEQTL